MSIIIGLIIGGLIWFWLPYLISKNININKAIKEFGASSLDNDEVMQEIINKARNAGFASIIIFVFLNLIALGIGLAGR